MTAREAPRDLVDAVFNAARLAWIHRDPRYAALRAIVLDMASTQPAPDAQPQGCWMNRAAPDGRQFVLKWSDGTHQRFASDDAREAAIRQFWRDRRAFHATVDAAEARA